jgi:Crp-like helix-turn-helix domain
MFTNEDCDVRGSLSITLGPWLQTLERHPALMAGPVKQRLYGALLDLAKQFGTPDQGGVILNLPLTQAMLADMIGAARQTVSSMTKDLERQDILFRDRRRLTVVTEALCEFRDGQKIAQGVPSAPTAGTVSY